MTAVNADDIASGLQRLGLLGKSVCLHSSLRSFRTIVGGADSVIDGFFAAGCTLIVPSFSSRFAVLPSEEMRPARNAWDYDRPPELQRVGRRERLRGLVLGARNPQSHTGAPGSYSPGSREIDKRMGAIPAAVVARPDHERGDHPLCSFSAIGARAKEAIDRQTWDDVYAPLQWLVENDGGVLLGGVGLTSMTLVHYAEQLAGRTLFRRWVLDESGATRMVPVGSCADGFDRLGEVLAPFSQRTQVGPSPWVSYPAAAALETLVQAIHGRPDLTHCGEPECVRCRDSIAGGPIL